MIIEMTIKNKEIQINMEELEIEVEVDSAGIIERITVDGEEPSEIENIVVRDNIREIEEEITWKIYQENKHSEHPLWSEV